MARTTPRKAFLVSASLADLNAVYAALMPSGASAVDAVAKTAKADRSDVAIVGLLTRKVVRNLKLKPGEVRRGRSATDRPRTQLQLAAFRQVEPRITVSARSPMLSELMHYTVTARCRSGIRKATRKAATSAMLLADRWAAEGCDQIQLARPDGAQLEREAFRLTLPLVRKLSAQMDRH